MENCATDTWAASHTTTRMPGQIERCPGIIRDNLVVSSESPQRAAANRLSSGGWGSLAVVMMLFQLVRATARIGNVSCKRRRKGKHEIEMYYLYCKDMKQGVRAFNLVFRRDLLVVRAVQLVKHLYLRDWWGANISGCKRADFQVSARVKLKFGWKCLLQLNLHSSHAKTC